MRLTRLLALPLVLAMLPGCQRASAPAPEAKTPAATQQAVAAPPTLPEGAVVRPAFDTVAGRFSAGTAFFVTLPGQAQPIGLTAHHLFGPAGGLGRELTGAELGRFVRSVSFTELDGGQEHASGPMLVLAAAGHAVEEGNWTPDLAAFRGTASLAPRALRLAEKNATVGEDVWLVAEVLGGRSMGKRLHRARVAISKPELLGYQFEDTTLTLRATSGAPVVNTRGEVVGINLAGGPEGDILWGNANPVENVRAQLTKALAATP